MSEQKDMSDLIKAALDEGTKDSAELEKKTEEMWLKFKKSPFPSSTYYRHLNNLQKIHEIKKTKIIRYELVIDNIDSKIEDCIRAINSSKNEEILSSRLSQLEGLLINKKISMYPDVLTCLSSSIDNKLITENLETFKVLVDILSHKLYSTSEPLNSNEDYKIRDNISLKLINLLKDKSLEYLRYSLTLLGYTTKKEAVDLIFQKINSDPLKALNGVSDSLSSGYARALAKLEDSNNRLIQQGFDQLINSGEETKIKVGKLLRKRVANEDLF